MTWVLLIPSEVEGQVEQKYGVVVKSGFIKGV